MTGSCPSVAIVFESIAPLTFSIVGHLACLAYVPHRPVFSPVLCGFRLTRFTCLTRCKGFCLLVVFLVFLVCFVCVFWFGLFVCLPVFGCLFPDSLCFFACLSSFTDWCTAHRQQFREQKIRWDGDLKVWKTDASGVIKAVVKDARCCAKLMPRAWYFQQRCLLKSEACISLVRAIYSWMRRSAP